MSQYSANSTKIDSELRNLDQWLTETNLRMIKFYIAAFTSNVEIEFNKAVWINWIRSKSNQFNKILQI